MAANGGNGSDFDMADEGVTAAPRTELRPSTVETIRDQLEFQRWRRPSWIVYHFPEVDRRGTPVDYADVESLTDRQADSIRHLLTSSIAYGRVRVRKRKARSFGLASDEPELDNEWTIRLQQLEEALQDLCAVFGIKPPE